jgi:hypothetical protein
MCLSHVVLAALTSLNDLLGVGHGCGPIEALPERLADEGVWVAWCSHVPPCTSLSIYLPSSNVMHLCLMAEALFL